jgi:hypothetical protein
MRIPRHYTLIQRMRDARLKLCVPRCPPLAACLVGQSRQRPGRQLTLKDQGRTRTVYVPQALMEEVKASIREHQRLRRLLREITQLELGRIAAYGEHQRHRGNRP